MEFRLLCSLFVDKISFREAEHRLKSTRVPNLKTLENVYRVCKNYGEFYSSKRLVETIAINNEVCYNLKYLFATDRFRIR